MHVSKRCQGKDEKDDVHRVTSSQVVHKLAARKKRVRSYDLLAINTTERRREQTKFFDEEGLVIYKNKITDVEDVCREDENELEGKASQRR